MFFMLSKLFWLVAQPISLVLILAVLALIFLLLNRRRLGLFAVLAAVLVLGAVGFTNLGYILIQPLEDRFALPNPAPEKVDAIVMLGGATLARPSSARAITELNDAGDRLTTTLWLARNYPEARIVISGGSGALSEEGEPEADTAERFFLAHGIPHNRLVLEEQSRNTDENVQLSKSLIIPDDVVVLVTSAFHMPRSVGLFRKAGLGVVPWPTDYRSPGPQAFGFDLANPVQNLNVTTVAIKEWIGLAAYHWSGRIDQLFPGS